MTTEKHKICYRSDGTIETGKRIIASLKAMGGTLLDFGDETLNIDGTDNQFYFIDKNGEIDGFDALPEGYTVFPLPPEENPKVGMSLQEVLNQVAQRHGYADWYQIDMTEKDDCERNEFKASVVNEVAELYASQFKVQQDKGEWERFRKPTYREIINVAIIFNNGSLDKEELTNIVSAASFIIDRLYENGDILIPTKQENEDKVLHDQE